MFLWEVGGGNGMGNTCKPLAVSFQCMTKSTTNKKKKMGKKKKILDVFMYICMKALRYPKRPFFIFKILFIYFDYTTSSLLSPVAASRRYSSLQHSGFSLLRLLALQSTGFRRTGSNACSVVARGLVSTGSEVVAQRRSCFVVWGILPDQGLNLFALG